MRRKTPEGKVDMKLFKPLKHKTAEGRPGRGIMRRRGCLPAAIVLGAAALLYYGAVWLVTERVKTMPEAPPPREAPTDENGEQ